MSSFLWYVCLGVVSTAPAVFAIYRKRHVYKISTLIVFYMFAACITWIGEFLVLGIFNSYAYKPGLFKDPWAQDIIGHLILNTTMYPAAATLMVSYSLGYGWIPLFAAIFVFAEYVFVSLGIYEQHWWNYYMSVITVVIFMIICKKWFHKMLHLKNKATRAVIYYFVGFLIIHIPIPLLLLAGKQHYRLALIDNLIGNTYRSSTILIFTYHLIEAFILVYFVCILKKWFWKSVPFVIAFAGQSVLAKMNILIFQGGWNLFYLILVYALSLALFLTIEQYTVKT